MDFLEERPGPALVRASRSAAMLVIGTRRLGAIGRLATESVSAYCLNRAHCPVLVVPADRPWPPHTSGGSDVTGA